MSVQKRMTSFVTHTECSRRVSIDDFNMGDYIQQGGWGKVFAATRKRDGMKVAMKFFGYTAAMPDVREINREIGLMIKLEKVQGVCQLVGIFDDTPSGLMEDKNPQYLQVYPVLVLEMLEGGDLFQQISRRLKVTEHFLAVSFRSAMTALQSIHERGFIHRDLKLDNIMCLEFTEPTEVKIIDFGVMLDVPYPQESLQTDKVTGTEGYFAPETLLRREYGYKSDVWQMGCILYSMLAGHPPFHADPSYRKYIALGKFYPFTGTNWAGVSAEAKDLVARMLSANPVSRITAAECLAHPWLAVAGRGSGGGEEDTSHDMGDQYLHRIKNLVLRNKFHRCFVDNCIRSDHIERIKVFKNELPFLDSDKIQANSHVWGISTSDYVALSEEYNSKLKKIKEYLMAALTRSCGDKALEVRGSDEESERPSKKKRRMRTLGVGFEEFCNLMLSVGLPSLATRNVFNIFDVDGDGAVNVKEFLLALVALKSRHGGEEEEEAARLYFSVFDVNENGFICRDEMAMVIDSLLHDGAGPLFDESICDRNVDEVFTEIDTDGNGVIDFSEFKKFYDAILVSSTVNVESLQK